MPLMDDIRPHTSGGLSKSLNAEERSAMLATLPPTNVEMHRMCLTTTILVENGMVQCHA